MKKIQDRIKLFLHKHDNAERTQQELENWTNERKDFLLSKLDWMESSLDKGNHEAYRIGYNQLKKAIENQEKTLNQIHELLLFEQEKK